VGKHDRAAISEAEFVADKRRNAALVRDALVVKIIARVEGGIAGKFKEAAVDLVTPDLVITLV